MKYLLTSLLVIIITSFIGCKKNKIAYNIKESTIQFNSDSTVVDEVMSNNIFEPNSVYRSYFSAAGLAIDGQFIFISTQSLTDDDFANADLQIKKTDLSFIDTERQELFHANTAKLNSVTPSLIKTGDNKYQFYYLRQESYSDAQIYVMESMDNGHTWKNERKVSFQPGYNGIINDRVVILSSGRIIIPVSFTSNINTRYKEQYIFCYYSDDGGLSWNKSMDLKAGTPLMEPSVAEYEKGCLLMVIRSQLGKLLFSRSLDNGFSWSVIEKSHLNSPASTSAIYKIGEGVLSLVWNNTTSYSHVHDRKPLSISLTRDQGQTWSQPHNLGKTSGEIYSSPGMFKVGNEWVIYYNYSRDGSNYGIRAKRTIIKY